MDAINHLAAIHGLWVVEDAAEAHLARYKDRKVGGLARMATFSFYGNKILTAGEGGAITVNDRQLEVRLRTLRGQGMDPERRYYFPVTGYNFRLTNVACAILCAQLERWEPMMERRRAIYASYEERLANIAGPRVSAGGAMDRTGAVAVFNHHRDAAIRALARRAGGAAGRGGHRHAAIFLSHPPAAAVSESVAGTGRRAGGDGAAERVGAEPADVSSDDGGEHRANRGGDPGGCVLLACETASTTVKHRWDIVTGEYPPIAGGVGDYTRLVACALVAQGDRVEVWAPSIGAGEVHDSGILVHRLADCFGPRALSQLSRSGAGRNGRRMILQYVPQVLGIRGMNLPLCLWLLSRRCLDAVMFHEVAYPIQRGQPIRHNILGVVTRVMAAIVARASTRVFVSIPAWETELRRHVPRHLSIRWVPLPSTIPVVLDPERIALARRQFSRGECVLFGHFGTYGPAITEALKSTIPHILESDQAAAFLLLGHGSLEFREKLFHTHPALARGSASCRRAGDLLKSFQLF